MMRMSSVTFMAAVGTTGRLGIGYRGLGDTGEPGDRRGGALGGTTGAMALTNAG